MTRSNINRICAELRHPGAVLIDPTMKKLETIAKNESKHREKKRKHNSKHRMETQQPGCGNRRSIMRRGGLMLVEELAPSQQSIAPVHAALIVPSLPSCCPLRPLSYHTILNFATLASSRFPFPYFLLICSSVVSNWFHLSRLASLYRRCHTALDISTLASPRFPSHISSLVFSSVALNSFFARFPASFLFASFSSSYQAVINLAALSATPCVPRHSILLPRGLCSQGRPIYNVGRLPSVELVVTPKAVKSSSNDFTRCRVGRPRPAPPVPHTDEYAAEMLLEDDGFSIFSKAVNLQ